MNFFATLLAVLAMASQTHAHSCMTDPPARMAPSGVYSEMCSAQKYELSSGNCNGGGGVGCRASQLDVDASVCGGPFQASDFNPKDLPWNGKKKYAAGSVINLSIYYRVSHTGGTTPGWVEARLCTDGNSLTQACFDTHKLTAVGGDGLQHTVGSSTPPWTTQTYAFQLPAGVTCSQCTLQYIWQTSSWDGMSGEQFQNCADISIGGAGAPSTPTETPANVPAEAPTGTDEEQAPAEATTSPKDDDDNEEVDAIEEEDGEIDLVEVDDDLEPMAEPGDAPKPAERMPTATPPVAPLTPPSVKECDFKAACTGMDVEVAPCACDANCQSIVSCSDGHAVLKSCLFFLRFNPAIMQCDWPSNVACSC